MSNQSNARKKIKNNILRFLALLFVILISVVAFKYSSEIEKFKAYGYPGIFLITLLSNATVFLPAPGIAIVFGMGSILNPFCVALTASGGAALGEISGYLAGFSSQAIIDRMDIYQKVEPIVRKYGGMAVIFFASIPNPFFDLAGIAAGGLKMSMRRFLLCCWIGEFIKMLAFSFAGYYSLNWFKGIT